MRRLWVTPHLRDAAEGAAAHRSAAALGRAVHERILRGGDRLAAASPLLAQAYYRHAAAAWRAYGGDGFARWLALGEALATVPPASRDAALAYFAVSPAAFARGLETAEAWWALGRRVAVVSRRLAARFFERTAAVVGAPDGLLRLAAWVAPGLVLHDSGWRGGLVAQAYFDAAPEALAALPASAYAVLADVALALAPVAGEREPFAAVAALVGWSPGDAERLLDTVRRVAATAPRPAAAVLRSLPPALAPLGVSERAAVLAVFASLDASATAAAAEVAPVVGAIVRAVPAGARAEALALVAALAPVSSPAAVEALRVLPRVYEQAAPAAVRRWFAAGTAVAQESLEGGRAFFALVSRTSVKVLRATPTAASLEETGGVWRKLVQMASGAPAVVRGIESATLRPPLEERPAAHGIALPSWIDWLPTHEENCRVYRVLALQLAGRRVFGTYAFGGDEEGAALRRHLRASPEPALLEALFLLCEGVRIHHRLLAVFPGVGADLRGLASRLLARWARDDGAPREVVLDAFLAAAVGGALPPAPPSWLAPAALVGRLVRPLAAPGARVEDAMRVAEALCALVEAAAFGAPRATGAVDLVLVDGITGAVPIDAFDDAGADEAPWLEGEGSAPLDDATLVLDAPAPDQPGEGRPLSPEDLRRLLERGARIEQGAGAVDGPGLDVTQLLGKLPAAARDGLRALAADDAAGPPRPRGLESDAEGPSFWYDEWDHRIADYRRRWCRLQELGVGGDAGEFFARALGDYARLVPEVRREFQRIRPEMYRTVRGLEDGEDFDLNAVVEARIEARGRRTPSSKVYRARVREVRDVATLFLLDMSASTDEPLVGAADGRPARRIIDLTKEALVVMTEALEALGDAYAIYGFSGQGRANVEFYVVKGFHEPLGATVKARIGGIAPRRSTRMGTALRHAIAKLHGVSARAKHLILLSDGFPQDQDYGEDRRSHDYGIRDTAVALREVDAAGITPFCITVDRAGHDYLRQMCEASRYVVIEDVAALPRELPKIYERVVRV